MKMKNAGLFYLGFLLAGLFSSSLALAAGVASCTVNGSWVHNPAPSAPQVCGTYVCCSSQAAGGGNIAFWTAGPSSTAALVCSHTNNAKPSSSCDETTLEIYSHLTLNAASHKLANGNSSAQCRYNQPCDGG